MPVEIPQVLQTQRVVYERHTIDSKHRNVAGFGIWLYVGGDRWGGVPGDTSSPWSCDQEGGELWEA